MSALTAPLGANSVYAQLSLKPFCSAKQAIGATDALRTGAYSKTLTFTLSTTTP